jgi:autotransporter passenger strand-loop-strand repeat protein
MPTNTISNGTTTVSTAVAKDTRYLVVGNGTLDVVDGGVIGGLLTIESGGQLLVSPGADIADALVLNGGFEFVQSGASTGGATVEAGGTETVLSGGTIDGTTLSGGTLIVANGATASGRLDFELSLKSGFQSNFCDCDVADPQNG